MAKYKQRISDRILKRKVLGKRATVAEVKRNIRKYSLEALEKKYALIKKNFRGYSVELRGLSLEDM